MGRGNQPKFSITERPSGVGAAAGAADRSDGEPDRGAAAAAAAAAARARGRPCDAWAARGGGGGAAAGACSGNLHTTERSRYFTHVCTAARRTYAGLQLRSAMDANQRICVSWHGVSVSPP
jgi:hypothetical protein